MCKHLMFGSLRKLPNMVKYVMQDGGYETCQKGESLTPDFSGSLLKSYEAWRTLSIWIL